MVSDELKYSVVSVYFFMLVKTRSQGSLFVEPNRNGKNIVTVSYCAKFTAAAGFLKKFFNNNFPPKLRPWGVTRKK